MPKGQCRLCEAEAELQLSHVIPAFAFRWLRESSGQSHLRTNREPNQRVQDGVKSYWLCSKCEQIFSRSETAFANRLFHPYLADPAKPYHYSQWLLHFCASLSWRTLRYFWDEHPPDDSWSDEARSRVWTAEAAWRDYLLGRRPNPGIHQQHLIAMDRIESHTFIGGVAPNINRYLMRAVHLDLCRGSECIFTYTKVGRFIIIGIVHDPNPTHWRGARVHATEGTIEPGRNLVLPAALWDYLNEKARSNAEALNGMSDRQHEKVQSNFRTNIDRYIGSDAFKAMEADVEMFGQKAFSSRKES
jgi:hypothetical protein